MRITGRIRDVLASEPNGRDEFGAVGVTYADLARRVYSVEEPARSQRVSVGRACRNLIAKGEAIQTEWAQTGERSWTTKRREKYTRVYRACFGPNCEACRYGARWYRQLDASQQAGFEEALAALDDDDANQGQLVLAAEFGVHVWWLPARLEPKKDVEHIASVWSVTVARPRTDEEQAAHDRAVAEREARWAKTIDEIRALNL